MLVRACDSDHTMVHKTAKQTSQTKLSMYCPQLPTTCRCCSNRSISPARRAHSSKPAAADLVVRAMLRQRGNLDSTRKVQQCWTLMRQEMMEFGRTICKRDLHLAPERQPLMPNQQHQSIKLQLINIHL